jgi:A/G-specific adenine glycosylase
MSEGLADRVLAWYASHKRKLPWRQTQDPYRIWVSEIMLQQTQVETVVPYYLRFLARFPTVQDLAGASVQEVFKAWENLGYYARARHLHAAARAVVDQWGGLIPGHWDGLKSLPGIGDYTAGAVLSMAFGQRVPAVDANVRRVMCRVYAVVECIDVAETQARLHKLAENLVPPKAPGIFNQALMDLGAAICKPRRPGCRICPIEEHCLAAQRGLQSTLPRRKKRGPVPHEHVTAGLIPDERGRVLIVRRPAEGLLGGLWKFPGGKQGRSATLSQALRSRVRREVGMSIIVGEALTRVNHAYTHLRITLHAFHCRSLGGGPRTLGCTEWRWVARQELPDFPFSKADREIVRALRNPRLKPAAPQRREGQR